MRSLLLLALVVGIPSGQGTHHAWPGADFASGAGPLAAPAQPDLHGAVSAFTRGWLGEDMAELAGRMSQQGIRLQVGAEDHPVLSARQARAALGDLLGSRSTRLLEVTRVVDLGGEPQRGYAELRWEAVVDRTSEALVHTVFVSFQRDEDAWRINEIRVL